ncbi:MAG: HAMP domain-containing histidine kinase [Rubrivivax sp.]|nr:MAG: HAMP domain-containing histidine kinase [Rubrivivax sp.]
MTLKRRVMLAMVALVALFTLVQGGIAVLSMHEQEDDLVDDLVLTEARRLGQRIDRSGPGVLAGEDALLLPDNYQAWWAEKNTPPVPSPLPASLAALDDGPHRMQDGEAEYHVMVMPVAHGRLFMRYNAERNEAKVHDFALQVLVLALIFIALAAWIARHVAGILVAPLARVTQLLDDWAPASEVDAPAVNDEENRLLDAFRRVQARWERGLTRESEQLADLRHEIRTPLAALRTDLEMLQAAVAPGQGFDESVRQRLARSLVAVDAVAGTLQTVHRQAPAPGAAPAAVPLADCVDDAWTSLGELPATRGLTLANEVGRAVRAQADRHALMTILRNLMRNAAEHAAPARCTVTQQGEALIIEDNGPGIPADELPFVFERYYRGRLADAPATAGPGAAVGDYERGLGLAIARQVAELQGWRLTVGAASPRGTRFTLDLHIGASI